MASNINPNNIDGNFPVAGQDNSSQGFRDNFTNTKQNFTFAEAELNDIQSKALFKAALLGETLDNNMNDNLLYAARVQDISFTRVAVTPASGIATINYAAGHYHTISTTDPVTLAFLNFPASGIYGFVKVQFNITNVSHTVTLPAAVSVGLSGIQGISPGTVGVSNTITFATTGFYELAFGTVDAGATITLFDLNRALTNFVSADIETNDVTATGQISAAGSVTGGSIVSDTTVSAAGNVIGSNINAASIVSATGNVVGGNIVTGGAVSSSGNIQGVNINGYVRPTVGGTTTNTVPMRFTTGSLVNFPTQTLDGGSMEYDGTIVYLSPTSNQRGIVPATILRTLSSNRTLLDSAGAQNVFDSPASITLAASTSYEFEAIYYLARSAGSTSRTLSTLFSLTGSLLGITYIAETTSTAGNLLGPVSRIRGTAATATVVTAASTSTTEQISVLLKGLVRTNTGGTFTPQVQFSATVGGAATILANSYFKIYPIGGSSVTNVGYWV